jgi:hypothetical protein
MSAKIFVKAAHTSSPPGEAAGAAAGRVAILTKRANLVRESVF